MTQSTQTLSKRAVRRSKRANLPLLKKRASDVVSRTIDYIDNPQFRRRNAEKQIVAVEPIRANAKRTKPRRPANVPAYFATLYETPLLTAEEESTLFRKFNYLKYRADRLRSKIKPDEPDETLLDEIEFFLAKAHEAWNELVQANLRLVVSIARRFVDSNHSFDELVSDGQIALMNAIEKFDFARGFRFSTYATHAIQRSFYRKIKNRQRDITRVKSTAHEVMEEVPDRFDGDATSAEDFYKIQHLLKWIEEELDERERHIVAARFGLNPDQESLTLRTIGQDLGISKERVRQIQIRAIDKLQELAGTRPEPEETDL
jgi:RNA polymerase primary sigma factor